MLNYKVDSAILLGLVPRGTELDQWHGNSYVSLVGFLFHDTRVKGLRVPFHTNFEEVNLRFYVKRVVGGEVRRGVVFVKEIVPRFAIATIARTLYNENYVSFPMSHKLTTGPENTLVEYSWRFRNRTQRIAAIICSEPTELAQGSHEEFITEHYWGYTSQRDGGTLEYKVEHPRWRVWKSVTFTKDIDVKELYGAQYARFLCTEPESALVAQGSPVSVYSGVRL